MKNMSKLLSTIIIILVLCFVVSYFSKSYDLKGSYDDLKEKVENLLEDDSTDSNEQKGG